MFQAGLFVMLGGCYLPHFLKDVLCLTQSFVGAMQSSTGLINDR